VVIIAQITVIRPVLRVLMVGAHHEMVGLEEHAGMTELMRGETAVLVVGVEVVLIIWEEEGEVDTQVGVARDMIHVEMNRVEGEVRITVVQTQQMWAIILATAM